MQIDSIYLKKFIENDLLSLGFDKDSLEVGIEAFIESLNDSFPNLVKAIEEKDYENIKFFAHSLKGTFGNFENNTFIQISELLKKIESLAKESKNFELIIDYFKQIKSLSKDWLII